MSSLQLSRTSVITVSEMAELCQLSRSRFYSLMDQGDLSETRSSSVVEATDVRPGIAAEVS